MSRHLGVACHEDVDVALVGEADSASESLRGVLHALTSGDLATGGSGAASFTGSAATSCCGQKSSQCIARLPHTSTLHSI